MIADFTPITYDTPTGKWKISAGGLLLSAMTTLGRHTRFNLTYCPDVSSWCHEYYHVIHTSWLRYAISYTIGRLWNDPYWKNEERAADAYQVDPANLAQPWLIALAADVRAKCPASSQTATINHPV